MNATAQHHPEVGVTGGMPLGVSLIFVTDSRDDRCAREQRANAAPDDLPRSVVSPEGGR